MTQFQINPSDPGMSKSGSLQPLQQTVFEKGPQAAFTPPPVANVYQESKVIFPSPEVRIQNSDIDWYALGAKGFEMARQTYGNVIDYLITSKINGVRDAKSEAQTKIYDIETKLSTEQYNADKGKRPKQTDLINDLVKQSNAAKEEYKQRVKYVLGDDYDALNDPNLEMNTMGLKYQELALTSRDSLRDIDRTFNRMAYQAERTNKYTQQRDIASDSWLQSGTARDDKNNQSLYTTGQAAIPQDKNGIPLFGVVRDENGAFKVKTGSNEQPVLVQHEGLDGWYFNISAIDGLDYNDMNALIDIEKSTPGTYLVSDKAGQFTKQVEELAINVAKSDTPSVGSAAFVGTALASVPETVASKIIERIPGLDSEERTKLLLYREHAAQGLPMQDITSIGYLNTDQLRSAALWTSRLALAGSDTIPGNINNQAELDAANQYKDYAIAIINTIDPEHKLDPSKYTYEKNQPAGGFTPVNNGGATLHTIIQNNPGLQGPIIRAIATMEANKGLFTDPATGTVDLEKRTKVLNTVLGEQIRRDGWIHLGPQANGAPVYAYAPGLVEMERVNNEVVSNPNTLSSWDPEVRNRFTEDGQFRQTVTAQTTLVANAPQTAEEALKAAIAISPTVDRELFTSYYNALRATTEVNINNNPGTGRVRSQTTPIMADVARGAIACTPAVMQKNGLVNLAQASQEEKFAVVKTVLDDLPVSEGKTFMPGVSVDLDTGASSQPFITAINGGLPVAFTQIKGKSGLDYIDLISVPGTRSFGRVVPKLSDGTPALMVNSVRKDRNTGTILHEGEYAQNMARISQALSGDFSYRMATANETNNNGSLVSPEHAENIILSVDGPYIPKSSQAIIINRLVDQPLTDSDTAITWVRQNGQAISDIVENDPTLAKVRGLQYEITRIPDKDDSNRYSPQTDPKKRVLFSDDNLKKLYDRAIADGATTQADFMGYVFGAMKAYRDNDSMVDARDFKLQRAFKAKTTDDTITSGPEKGRILWKPGSEQFTDFVIEEARKGNSVIAGPAPEDKSKKAFYVRNLATPQNTNNTVDTTTLVEGEENTVAGEFVPRMPFEGSHFQPGGVMGDEMDIRQAVANNALQSPQDGYAVVADATMLEKIESSEVGKQFKSRKERKRIQDILFPTTQTTEETSNTVSFKNLNRQQSLSSEMRAEFKQAVIKWMSKSNLYDSMDLPFIDLAKFWADNNQTLPTSLDNIDSKYILPGHSSTLRLVDRANLSPDRGEAGQVNLPLSSYIKAHIKGLQATTSTLKSATQDTVDNLSLWNKVAGQAAVFNTTLSDYAMQGAAYPIGAITGTVGYMMQRGSPTQEDAKLKKYREDQLAAFKESPLTWFEKTFDKDPIQTLRDSPSSLETYIPTKMLDVIAYVKEADLNYSDKFDVGLGKQTWDKLKTLPWSGVELEYQIRQNAINYPDWLEDVNTTIQNLDAGSFKLDSGLQSSFAQDLYNAAQESGVDLTMEQAKEFAADPKYKPELKRSYFNMTLYPDGYLAKTSKTTKESVVDSMSELDNLYDTADDASMSTSPGTVSDKPYVNLISRFEGMKTEAYWDNTGKVWTIGKGTTTYRDGTPVKKGDKISKEEADNLLQDFVDTKIIPQLSTKIPTWNEMNPNQQAALISFAYNVGPNFYGQKGFETLTKAVSSVDSFDQVPRALRLYTKSGGKKLKGLVKRRNAEATLWQS